MTYVELEKRSYEHPIILYDGFCFLCDKTIKYLIDLDKDQQLRYHTLESENTEPDTVKLLHKGAVYKRSDVLVQLSIILVNPSWMLKIVAYFPKIIRDLGYRLVASNRYAMWGKSDTCLLPGADTKHLFLS